MRRFGVTIAVSVGLVWMAAGCTSSGHDNGSAPLGGSTSGGSTSGGNPPSTIVPTVPTVLNKTFWYAGFKLTVTTATRSGPSEVQIVCLMLNQGDTTAPLDANIDLASGSHHYPLAPASRPDVPGQTQAQATLTFNVDANYSADDAILTFGRPTEVQAVVPLGRAGRLVDLQPRPVTASGKLTVNSLAVTLATTDLRADIPALHRQAAKGQRELLFRATVALSRGDPTVVDTSSLRLERPDRALVSPDAVSTVTVAPGAPGVDVTASFPVPEAAAGKYRLVLQSRPADSGSSTASVGFTIEPG